MRCVVVGAGSAGCVAARRLHDAGHDVVVIEAGPPLVEGHVPRSIDGDDSFAAIGEPGRLHLDVTAARTVGAPHRPYLRGRGVGGSSAINSMIALRGDPEVYRSWGWDDADDAFDRILVPREPAELHELGIADRLLLGATPAAALVELTRRSGRRVTAAESYLWPCASSDRLTVVSGRRVDVVRFDDSASAVGVVLDDGAVVDADQVILAAGAIHSPAILLRSGLGDHNIGHGLMDHPSVGFTLTLAPELLHTSARNAAGLVTATSADLDPVQLLPLNHLGPGASANFAMLLVALMRPVGAAGTVSLRSDDPHVEPDVELRMLTDPVDVSRLRSGIRGVLDMLATAPFSDAVTDTYIDDVGTTTEMLDSDDAIDAWMLRRGADYVHATSSCARGLDADGRVRGHDGVYVWDASAFPSIPNANTHWPTMMLAERLSARWIDVEGSAK